eukprot:m.43318 g.43318  ORF g.43318 m.43318 type:complete len:1422 (+) comp9966_c0_seq2:120-4385(+)
MPAPTNAVYVIQGEMSMVVSCMRRNARWASAEQDQQDPLLQSFGILKQDLASVTDIHDIDVERFLGPFLDVVRSEVVGPITGVALSSINKFLAYGLIDSSLPNAASGIESIADAVTHTKFMGTNLASDEVVLMKILQVLRTLLLTPVGSSMSNEAVCELMQTCFKICFEMRLSELLRRCAEQTLIDMIHLLFSRLAILTVPDQNESFDSPVKNSLKRNDSVTEPGFTYVPPSTSEDGPAAEDGLSEVASESSQVSTTPQKKQTFNRLGVRFTPQSPTGGKLASYGIPCIRELFRFNISLINPRDRHNNETMIGMGLSLLTVAMETGGANMARFPGLRAHLEDDMCRNLFELLKTENLTLYAASLRVIFLMFEALRSSLKFQLERFLLAVCELSDKTSYEHKEGALDLLLQLCRIPGFLIDVYINFDCNLHCANLFDTVLSFLSQNAFPEEDRVFTTHLNALDCMMTIINEIASRQGSEEPNANLAPVESLLQVKERKSKLISAVELFNKNPKKGLAFLAENGFFLTNPGTPEEIAKFMRSNQGLDKAMIGDYIGRPKNKNVLVAFVHTFDVSHLPIDQALRAFLESFRLPGEAPVISNILESFAELWYTNYQGEKIPASSDSAYILCYAIMQLNTDQHNPQVKKKMTFKDFVKNQRKLNDNKDFPEDFLQEIFNNIRNNEIVLPAERSGSLKEEYDWKLMLIRARDKSMNTTMTTYGNNSIYDLEMFLLIWKPTITALYHVFDTTTEGTVVKKVTDSLAKCAAICGKFELCDVFDFLIIGLCKRTLLTTRGSEDREGVDDSVSNFRTSEKAQTAARTVFSLAREYGDILRHGWEYILDVVLHMFQDRLLPEDMTTVTGLLKNDYSLLPEIVHTEEPSESSIMSYFWRSETENNKIVSEGTEEQNSIALNAVKDCQIKELVATSAYLIDDSLRELLKALMHLSRSPVSFKSLGTYEEYNEPQAAYFLEMLYEVALANKDRIWTLWDTVFDHFHSIIQGAGEREKLPERAIICLIRLGERLYKSEKLSDKVLLAMEILIQLPDNLSQLPAIRAQLTAGAASFIKANVSFINLNGWKLLLKIMQGCPHKEANELAAEALQKIADHALTQDNTELVQQTTAGFVVTWSTQGETDDTLALKILSILRSLHIHVHLVCSTYSPSDLWNAHWEYLLQTMSRFCTAADKKVRTEAFTILQSSLMLDALDRLTPIEWKACLVRVIFPLLQALLDPPGKSAPGHALEESRVRSCQFLSKVFLQHLSELIKLDDFVTVWLTMLGYYGQYMKAGTDSAESVPETLKNLLLVMSTQGILTPGSQTFPNCENLWKKTQEGLDAFLPGLFNEVFTGVGSPSRHASTLDDTALTHYSTEPGTPHTNINTPLAPYVQLSDKNSPVPFPHDHADGDGDNMNPRTPPPNPLQLHSTPITI